MSHNLYNVKVTCAARQGGEHQAGAKARQSLRRRGMGGFTHPDRTPTTVEEAADMVVAGCDDATRKALADGGWDDEHRGLGWLLRNGWSMWSLDTPLKRDAAETYSIAHADDMSSLIIRWAAARICKDDGFDPVRYASRFHEHWGGRDEALAAGGWPGDKRGCGAG